MLQVMIMLKNKNTFINDSIYFHDQAAKFLIQPCIKEIIKTGDMNIDQFL